MQSQVGTIVVMLHKYSKILLNLFGNKATNHGIYLCFIENCKNAEFGHNTTECFAIMLDVHANQQSLFKSTKERSQDWSKCASPIFLQKHSVSHAICSNIVADTMCLSLPCHLAWPCQSNICLKLSCPPTIPNQSTSNSYIMRCYIISSVSKYVQGATTYLSSLHYQLLSKLTQPIRDIPWLLPQPSVDCELLHHQLFSEPTQLIMSMVLEKEQGKHYIPLQLASPTGIKIIIGATTARKWWHQKDLKNNYN